jgi:hypothetical protein
MAVRDGLTSDIPHSESLLMALTVEAAINPPDRSADLFEGVNKLRALIQTIQRKWAGHGTCCLSRGIRINDDSIRSLPFGPNYSTQTNGYLGRC